MRRIVHITFSRTTTDSPDRSGFDPHVFEQELLCQTERHGVDTVQQMINEGSVTPTVSIEREDGSLVEVDPTYVSDLLPPRGPLQGRR